MSDDDNIHYLGPPRTPTTGVKDHSYRDCKHLHIITDRKRRTIQCEDCKEVLDPFDVVYEYAGGERMYHHWRAEETRVRRRLYQLKEEEKRVKARTRNASRKDAETAVAAERARWEERMGRIAFDALNIARLAGVKQKGGAAVRRMEVTSGARWTTDASLPIPQPAGDQSLVTTKEPQAPPDA